MAMMVLPSHQLPTYHLAPFWQVQKMIFFNESFFLVLQVRETKN
jgi:hypothetical protein